MKLISERELIDRVIRWIRQYNCNSDHSDLEIAAETNIMSTGLLDSFGFIELIEFLENETGCKIDLSDIAPTEFPVVKSLCRYVIGNHPSGRKVLSEENPIVATYSELADRYDDALNMQSCWERSANKALSSISIKDSYKTVLDVGCGTGKALSFLASKARGNLQFIGVEPAANMRKRAVELTRRYPNIKIVDGSFEKMPVDSNSVDYLYSVFAFHWTTDLERSVDEISRALKPGGEMDLFFAGRKNGQEFIKKTTPIFLKYMGPALLLESAGRRKQLTKDAAYELFSRRFSRPQLAVEESFETYYDQFEIHWGWWVRTEGHFANIPDKEKEKCDREVKEAISTLATEKGIPYTIHLLHVKLKSA